jgi:hypothetical protein
MFQGHNEDLGLNCQLYELFSIMVEFSLCYEMFIIIGH